MKRITLSAAQLVVLRLVRASDEDHGGLGSSELQEGEHEELDVLLRHGMIEAVGEYGEAPDGEEDEREAGASAVVYRVTARGVAALRDG